MSKGQWDFPVQWVTWQAAGWHEWKEKVKEKKHRRKVRILKGIQKGLAFYIFLPSFSIGKTDHAVHIQKLWFKHMHGHSHAHIHTIFKNNVIIFKTYLDNNVWGKEKYF